MGALVAELKVMHEGMKMIQLQSFVLSMCEEDIRNCAESVGELDKNFIVDMVLDGCNVANKCSGYFDGFALVRALKYHSDRGRNVKANVENLNTPDSSFHSLVRSGIVRTTETFNNDDDWEIIQTAMELNAILVSNDYFRDFVSNEQNTEKQKKSSISSLKTTVGTNELA